MIFLKKRTTKVVHDERSCMSKPGARGVRRKISQKKFCQSFSGVKGPLAAGGNKEARQERFRCGTTPLVVFLGG